MGSLHPVKFQQVINWEERLNLQDKETPLCSICYDDDKEDVLVEHTIEQNTQLYSSSTLLQLFQTIRSFFIASPSATPHRFHATCLNQWVNSQTQWNSSSCPLCRISIETNQENQISLHTAYHYQPPPLAPLSTDIIKQANLSLLFKNKTQKNSYLTQVWTCKVRQMVLKSALIGFSMGALLRGVLTYLGKEKWDRTSFLAEKASPPCSYVQILFMIRYFINMAYHAKKTAGQAPSPNLDKEDIRRCFQLLEPVIAALLIPSIATSAVTIPSSINWLKENYGPFLVYTLFYGAEIVARKKASSH